MMIDGNKLMLALSEWWYSSFGLEETEESKAIHKVMDEVERYVDHEKTAGYWIPCSERLPEEEKKTYWVCTNTEYQCECRWTNNRFGFGEGEWGWSIFDTPQYSKPIAWMPLPKPYKGGEDE